MPAETNQIEPATKQTIAQKFADFSAAGLSLGMGGVLAATMLALASPNGINDQQLATLLGSLGANWISTAVWELRAKLRNKAAVKPDLQPIAEEWQAQLSDERLGEILQKLGVMDETLKALEKQPDKAKPLTEELLALGLATKGDLEQALSRVNVGNTVRVNVQSVINSVFINAGGDVNVYAPITIMADSQRVGLDKAIEAHRNEIFIKLRGLDLDPYGVTLADDQSETLELADIYTPLYAAVFSKSKNSRPLSNEEALAQQIVVMDEQKVMITDEQATVRVLRGKKDEDKPSIIASLNDAPRVVVLGDPGCGKSTVLNYLALGLCGKTRDARFAEEWHHQRLIPLRVELRNFARWADKRAGEPHVLLLDYVREATMPKAAKMLAEHLEQTLCDLGGAFLLDGLDEVPAPKRNMIKKAVEGLMERYPRCRFVITCRTYSYQDPKQKFNPKYCSMSEMTISDLDDAQITEFVSKWYRQLEIKRGKPNLGSNLIEQLRNKNNPRLRKLASTPLMLTLITSLHSTEKSKLPNERHELMKQAVELLLERWERANKRLDVDSEEYDMERRVQRALQRKGKDALLAALYQVAFDAHRLATSSQIKDEEATADIPERMLRNALEGVLKDEDITKDDLTNYLRYRAGLLINKGDDPNAQDRALSEKEPVYRFPHRMFQEYMAAMLYKAKPKTVADLLKDDFERWREVYALMALSNDELGTLSCVNRICATGKMPQNDLEWQLAVLSANIWADKKLAGELDDLIADNIAHIKKLMTDLMGLSCVLIPRARAEAGRKLAALPNPDPATYACADHRHAACANLLTAQGRAAYLQDGFVDVVYAPFTMQAGERNAGRAPAFSPVRMAKTPVTVAQFGAFVQAGGYDTPEFWNWSPNAAEWLKNTQRKAPRYWNNAQFHHLNSPVVGVTWYEAMAFCHWLTRVCWPAVNPSHSQGSWFDLPTELEWEFAARGTEGRAYAFKEGSWQKGDELKCNVDETGIGTTSAVGMFADGATPQGIFDMTGNVWEWMRNEWDDDWSKAINKTDINGDNARALRGGSFSNNQDLARCANRFRINPDFNFNSFGFRVVVRA